MPDDIVRNEDEGDVIQTARDGNDRIRLQKPPVARAATRYQVARQVGHGAGDDGLMPQKDGVDKESGQSALLKGEVGIHPKIEVKARRGSLFPHLLTSRRTLFIQKKENEYFSSAEMASICL